MSIKTEIKTQEDFIEVLILEVKKTQSKENSVLDINEFIERSEVNNYLNSININQEQDKTEKVKETIRAITYTGNAKKNPKGTIKGSVKYRYKNYSLNERGFTQEEKHKIREQKEYTQYNRFTEIFSIIQETGEVFSPKKFLAKKENKELAEHLISTQGSVKKAENCLEGMFAIFSYCVKKNKKTGKFKRSSHLTDQILKYTLPATKKTKQLSIWDILAEGTKTDIEVANIERSEIVEGIKLSGTETKLIDSLCKLLHDKSEVYDKKAPNYYTGNGKESKVIYLNEEFTLPKIAVTLYELTQVYKGDEKYISGKDIENVKEVLTELSGKKFLIKYIEKTKDKSGKWIEKGYEGFRDLITLDKAFVRGGDVDNIETYKKTETIITLNPIFRRQIDSKFILYPHDINKRTAIAYGGEKVSGASLKLRDYLMREHASKHYSPEISLYKLSYLLAENLMKASRKADAEKSISKALITCKNLGILESYTKTENIKGEPKYIFNLKKDWE